MFLPRRSTHSAAALAAVAVALALATASPAPHAAKAAAKPAAAKPAAAKSAPGAHAGAMVPFIEDDWTRAVAEAKQRNLPLFVESWAPW